MLPDDDPVLRGRLVRAARVLLGWSQAGLACAAGVGTALVYRVEAGCPGAGVRAAAALAAAVERAGVRFLGPGGASGHGLRYAAPCPAPGGPPGGGRRADLYAAASARVARQRALVARLEAADAGAAAQAELARVLLAEMERLLATMARSRGLVTGAPVGEGPPDETAAPPPFRLAA